MDSLAIQSASPTRAAGVADETAAPLSRQRVVVFFTRGMSLQAWRDGGMLERELAAYRRLAEVCERLTFVSYGDAGELEFAPQLGRIAVLPNRWRLNATLYSVVAPLLHARALRHATVFRTHQLNGAWCGALAKWLFGAPLVVRSGYVWSAFVARSERRAWRVRLARRIERLVLRAADHVIVATDADRQALLARGVAPRNVTVIPNSVDTDRFSPGPDEAREPGRLCFIGRLDAQKNPMLLLEAIRGLEDIRVTMIGDGPLRPALERTIRAEGLPVELLGARPHAELPAHLRRAELFALPSRYEGHPKALLEAMACGTPVIGTDVAGIRSAIAHDDTGWLCPSSPDALRAAIQTLHGDAARRRRLGQAARRAIEQTCSVERIAAQELAVLAQVGRASRDRGAAS